MLIASSQLMASHGTTLHDPILRLQSEGFQLSPEEDIKKESTINP